MKLKDTRFFRHPWGPALVCFIIGLAISSGLAAWRYHDISQEYQQRWQAKADLITAEISRRWMQPVYGLNGARGIYAASKTVERHEFKAYVDSRDLENEFPGVRGFGFIERVSRKDLGAFIAATRADEAPHFNVRQLADQTHPDLYVIKFIEPLAQNAAALGLDVGSEANRREAIQHAIDTGRPSMTRAITLVQDNTHRPGVLIYVPIYAHGPTPTTPAQRRAALVGVAYAPVIVASLFSSMPEVQQGEIDFELFNHNTNTPLYDVDNHLAQKKQGAYTPIFSQTRTLTILGQDLRLDIRSTLPEQKKIDHSTAWLIFATGAALSALLANLLRQQTSGLIRAEALANAMTRDNAALLETLNLHAIVSVSNAAGVITAVNDAFCRISGYSRNELIGSHHRIVNSALHTQEFWQDMWKTISSGMPWRGEVCNRAKNGDLYWVDTFIAPFIGDDGKIDKYISIRTDITTAKNHAHALEKATHTATEATRAKSQFLANMSHELRTPMNAILGMLALLRKTPLTERQADYAVKSENAARSLLALLNEILDFSKIEAGKMTLDPQPFSLQELISNLSVILSPSIGSKPVDMRFAIDPKTPPYLVGDAMRLQQVLVNLGSNAIKFTERGSVVLCIENTGSTPHQATLRISVRDSGIGIAPENQTRIFSGFTQAEASTTRRFGGTGLGVAISQRFVQLMGGTLSLHSTLGQGSEFFFTISLPIAHAPAPKTTTVAPSAPNHRTSQPLAGLHLLVVEDNLNNQQIAKELLEDEGASVTLANNGQESIDAIITSQHPFDLVLMDLQMPVMDGLTATQKIRNDLQLHKLPIIAMTANAMDSDRQACLNAGMNAHVGKPFDLQNLIHVIQQHTGLHAPAAPATAHPDTPPEAPPHVQPPQHDLAYFAHEAGIQLDEALSRLGGKTSIYHRMLGLFVDDLASTATHMRQLFDAGDTASALRAAHTFKGLAATMGATGLADQARHIEICLKETPSLAPQSMAKLHTDISHILPAMHALRNALSPTPTPEHSMPATDDMLPTACVLLLKKMVQQLNLSDMDALESMADLQRQCGVQFEHRIAPLASAMASLDFGRALRCCHTLLDNSPQP